MKVLPAIVLLSALGASFAVNGPPGSDKNIAYYNGEATEESFNKEVEIGLLRHLHHTGFECIRTFDTQLANPEYHILPNDANRQGVDLSKCEPAEWDTHELNCDNSLPDAGCHQKKSKISREICPAISWKLCVKLAGWYGKPLMLEECQRQVEKDEETPAAVSIGRKRLQRGLP